MADRHEPDQRRFLMGLGLDSDGHARITKGDDYILFGGSEKTHGTMQESVERFAHALEKRGTDIQHASREEMLDAAEESGLLQRRPRRR